MLSNRVLVNNLHQEYSASIKILQTHTHTCKDVLNILIGVKHITTNDEVQRLSPIYSTSMSFVWGGRECILAMKGTEFKI